jgi:hypothetical protein
MPDPSEQRDAAKPAGRLIPPAPRGRLIFPLSFQCHGYWSPPPRANAIKFAYIRSLKRRPVGNLGCKPRHRFFIFQNQLFMLDPSLRRDRLNGIAPRARGRSDLGA